MKQLLCFKDTFEAALSTIGSLNFCFKHRIFHFSHFKYQLFHLIYNAAMTEAGTVRGWPWLSQNLACLPYILNNLTLTPVNVIYFVMIS